MEDELHRQLDVLEHAVRDLEKAAKQALGFTETVHYRGIAFNVSRRFVLAELEPLAFFHLVEHIDDGVGPAIVRLYDRLGPLLECRHVWKPLERADDAHVLAMAAMGSGRAFICRSCTAYSLSEPLPMVGRKRA